MEKELTVNPWLKMWSRPREAIRAIIQYNPSFLLPLLYWVYGFPILLQTAQNLSLGGKFPLLASVIGAAIFAIVVGWIGINVGSALFYWTGKWIGGLGSCKEIRAAVAWSTVPSLLNGVIWIIQLSVFKSFLLTEQFLESQFVGVQMGVVFVTTLAQTILAVWGFIMLLNALAEVQQFSIWKALLNVFLPVIVILVGLKIITWLFLLFTGGMH